MNPELEEWITSNGSVVKEEKNFTVYELEGEVKYEDARRKIRQVTLGHENSAEVKTVLLLGETGAGKSTFFNVFLNMVFGVTSNDKLRVRLKSPVEQSTGPVQTTYVTDLTIYHQDGMPHPYNYRIIDTPGLDCAAGRGMQDYGELCIKNYLAKNDLIKYINSVGIIWKSSNITLTENDRDVLSKIDDLLGYDIRGVTDVLLTFCAFGDKTAAETVRDAGIEYKEAFCFNNAFLYLDPLETMKRAIHEVEWQVLQESYLEFLKELNQRGTQDLEITLRLISAQRNLENFQDMLKTVKQQKAMITERITRREIELSELQVKMKVWERRMLEWDRERPDLESVGYQRDCDLAPPAAYGTDREALLVEDDSYARHLCKVAYGFLKSLFGYVDGENDPSQEEHNRRPLPPSRPVFEKREVEIEIQRQKVKLAQKEAEVRTLHKKKRGVESDEETLTERIDECRSEVEYLKTGNERLRKE